MMMWLYPEDGRKVMEQELGAILHKRKQVGLNNQKKQLKELNTPASGEWQQGFPAA